MWSRERLSSGRIDAEHEWGRAGALWQPYGVISISQLKELKVLRWRSIARIRSQIPLLKFPCSSPYCPLSPEPCRALVTRHSSPQCVLTTVLLREEWIAPSSRETWGPAVDSGRAHDPSPGLPGPSLSVRLYSPDCHLCVWLFLTSSKLFLYFQVTHFFFKLCE